MAKQRTKGQHYLPRSAYLEHFVDSSTDKPVLWVYPFDNNGIRINEEKGIPAAQLCKETYLYESPLFRVNEVEQYLEKVESGYSKILKAKILNKIPITDDEKLLLSLFITTLEARLPSTRDNLLQFIDNIEEKIKALEDQYNEGKETKEHQDIKKAKGTIFSQNIAIASELNRWQFSSFMFLHNEHFEDPKYGGYFITSDSPVSLYDFTFMNSLMGVPPSSPTAELLIPLTPSLLLFINNRGLNGYNAIDPNFIAEANNRTLNRAQKRIISPYRIDEKVVERIIRRQRQSFILQYEIFEHPKSD